MPDNTKMAERYAAYVALRDDGVDWLGARDAVGVGTSTAERYERAYRRDRKLPPKERWRVDTYS
jgi:hypothetical protein